MICARKTYPRSRGKTTHFGVSLPTGFLDVFGLPAVTHVFAQVVAVKFHDDTYRSNTYYATGTAGGFLEPRSPRKNQRNRWFSLRKPGGTETTPKKALGWVFWKTPTFFFDEKHSKGES